MEMAMAMAKAMAMVLVMEGRCLSAGGTHITNTTSECTQHVANAVDVVACAVVASFAVAVAFPATTKLTPLCHSTGGQMKGLHMLVMVMPLLLKSKIVSISIMHETHYTYTHVRASVGILRKHSIKALPPQKPHRDAKEKEGLAENRADNWRTVDP